MDVLDLDADLFEQRWEGERAGQTEGLKPTVLQ